MIQEFVSGIDVNASQNVDDENDEISDVVTQAGVDEIFENQVFQDKKLLKDKLTMYAIKNNFKFIVYMADKREYVLKCKDEGYKWRFRSSSVYKTDMFKVRYIRNKHTCTMDILYGITCKQRVL